MMQALAPASNLPIESAYELPDEESKSSLSKQKTDPDEESKSSLSKQKNKNLM